MRFVRFTSLIKEDALLFSQSSLLVNIFKGRTIRKVMGGGGEGNFRAAGIFFRYQIPCMNFFYAIA